MATLAIDEKPTAAPAVDIEKSGAQHEVLSGEKIDSETDSVNKQQGVKQIEAITTVWSKPTLIAMFILLYVVSFIDMLIVSLEGNLKPYITSSFQHHGLLATIGIVSSILGGSSKLAIAKIIDIWGRVEGFVVMLLLSVVGLILIATSENVQAYAAGNTIYWVGHLGLLYVVDVMLADMTTLRNRMIIFGINQTPTIATTFAGPKIAELFYENVNFRWAFGAFIIILVVFCAPVAVVFLWHQRKAIKVGVFHKDRSERKWHQSIWHYIIELDLVGIILTTAGFSLFLLPFSLANTAPKGWASASIITMLVIGVACLAAFYVWEKDFAPVQYFPFRYLKERTIIGSCLLYGIMFISIFAWDAYYGSYLQVVHFQNITHSGYILNSFSLMSSFISPFIGFLIHYTGEFKWTAYSGIPFVILGTALLIPFRTPSTHVGILVMCQLLNGIGTGIFAICSQLAIMAVISHQEIAVALALWGMFGSIGAAVGFAIAGALWTNIMPNAILNALPEDSKHLAAEIYADITVQMSYPKDSPIRDAIIVGYADVQRKMVIVGAAFVPLMLLCIFMWRNVNVKKLEREKGAQTKGNVF